MVAPLVAAGGRVVAGSARTTHKTTAEIVDQKVATARQAAIAQNRSLRRSQDSLDRAALTKQTRARAAAQNSIAAARNQRKKSPVDSLKTAVRRVRASMTAVAVVVACFMFYIIQVLAALLYTEYIDIGLAGRVAYLLSSGIGLNALAFVIVIVLGIYNMTQAFMLFFITGTLNLRSSLVWLSFPLCFAGSLWPYTALFPWVFLWSLIVVYAQK